MASIEKSPALAVCPTKKKTQSKASGLKEALVLCKDANLRKVDIAGTRSQPSGTRVRGATRERDQLSSGQMLLDVRTLQNFLENTLTV